MKSDDKINIYDVAGKAGVSIATVSRVLSNSPKVRPETKRKVLNVIKSTGYSPNVFARGLSRGTTKMAGILCTDVSDLYYANAVSSLERLLHKNELDSLLYCTGNDLADKKRYIQRLIDKQADAVILVGSAFSEQLDNSHIEAVAAKNIPIIIINGLVESKGVYCVLCDEKSAMRDNVLRFYRHGCRNILYLYDALTYSGLRKLEGYNKGLDECGLEQDPALTIRCSGDFSQLVSFAEEALNTLHIDGILASEDKIAIAAQKAMAKLGISLPLIGFNNSILAQCATPSLSSVDNMLETLCSSAAELLGLLLNKAEIVPSKIVVDAKYIQRESFQTVSI